MVLAGGRMKRRAPDREAQADGDGSLAAVLARALVSARWLVTIFWSVLAAVSLLFLPTITEASGGGGIKGFVPGSSETLQTERRSVQEFGFPLQSRTVIVQRDPDGLPPRVQARAVRRAVALREGRYPEAGVIRGALPIANTFRLFPGSRESGTTVVTYLFAPPDAGLGARYAPPGGSSTSARPRRTQS